MRRETVSVYQQTASEEQIAAVEAVVSNIEDAVDGHAAGDVLSALLTITGRVMAQITVEGELTERERSTLIRSFVRRVPSAVIDCEMYRRSNVEDVGHG